jgi:hypothetical protein
MHGPTRIFWANLYLTPLSLKGPVAISVSVSGGFRGYKAGVLRAPGCANFKIDHGVSLVGYDTSPAAQGLANSTGYWILRNSWWPPRPARTPRLSPPPVRAARFRSIIRRIEPSRGDLEPAPGGPQDGGLGREGLHADRDVRPARPAAAALLRRLPELLPDRRQVRPGLTAKAPY